MTGSRGRPGATRSCRTSRPASGSAPTREAPPADLAGPRNRGVRDILIACVDGLASFAVAVTAAFPAAVVRPCAAPHPQPAAARTANATTSPPASSRASSRPPTRRRLPWQGYNKPGEHSNSKSFAHLGVQAHARSMLGSAPWRRGLRGRDRLLGGPGIPRALGATYGQVIGRRSRLGPRRWLRARASRRSRRRPCGRRRGSRRR